ncbi:MAG: hypothetical protein JXP73_13130 [Deltaproteobacteria bacterium]|nr:hypothetical protein [Deltaproteobacteria bacterium]
MPIELLLKVSDLGLSVRAAGCVEKLGVVRIGDLVGCVEHDLLGLKNCGRRTIKEITVLLTGLGLSLGMTVPVWKTADVALIARKHAGALARIRQRLFKDLYKIDSTRGVETEVSSALRAVLKPRDLPKVELWIGLDLGSLPTLQAIGDVADVSRERIRQIIEKAKARIELARLPMPRLNAAARLLGGASALTEPQAQYLLSAQGVTERKVSMRGLLRAAEFFGVPTQVRHAKIGGGEFFGTDAALGVCRSAIRAGRHAVEHWGCSTIDDVCAQVSNTSDGAAVSEAVRHALETQPGFRWLDEDTRWFWFEEVPRNRVLNKVDKILAVAPKVDLSDLRAGIARHYRMDGFAPPSRVLRALCEQIGDCDVVNGRTVVDKRPRDPTTELSDQECAMVEVFHRHGPALTYADAMRLCSDAGLNETTTGIYLANSPVLRRVTMGVYTLVGAAVTPGEIETVAKTVGRSRRKQVMQDHGWRPDGAGVWVTYRISQGILRSGVLGVPAGIRKCLDPQGYDLHGADEAKMGRVRIRGSSMWGFLPFFRRRGGDVGDFLRITFRLTEHIARIEVAQEPFDDSVPGADEKSTVSGA